MRNDTTEGSTYDAGNALRSLRDTLIRELNYQLSFVGDRPMTRGPEVTAYCVALHNLYEQCRELIRLKRPLPAEVNLIWETALHRLSVLDALYPLPKPTQGQASDTTAP